MTSRQDRMQQMCSQYLDEDLKRNILFAQLMIETPFLGVLVTNDDLVYALGTAESDNFGLGPVAEIPKLTKIDSLCGKNIRQFAAGINSHILALSEDGVVYAWGDNQYGQLGNNSKKNSPRPIVVAGDLRGQVVKQVGAGHNFSVALTKDGNVYTWGNNQHNGRTGHGTTSGSTLSPRVVKGRLVDMVVAKISCNRESVLCLTQEGDVFGFGSNNGNLGLSSSATTQSIPELTLISQCRKIRDISCGVLHSLALTDAGILFVCGRNECGQLGTGNKIDLYSPTQTRLSTNQQSDSKVVRIFAEGNTSFAMDDNERVYAWGLVNGEHVLRPTVFDITFPESGYKRPSLPSSSSGVISDLLEAFDDEETSDFVINVEGKDIHVHKSILQIRSLYFRTMLNNEWKETENGKVVVDQHPYRVYHAFLRYIYCGELSELAPEESLRLMDLATMTLDDRLVKLCEKRIKKDLTPNNLIKVFSEAQMLKNDELVNYCVMQVDLKAFKKVVKSSAYQEIPGEHVREFVHMCMVNGVFDT